MSDSAPWIAIRVDASIIIGTGHLKRCLTLVLALMEQGARVCLIVRALDGVATQLVGDAPCPVRWLPEPSGDIAPDSTTTPHATWAGVNWQQDVDDTANALSTEHPDWLVVDHYAFDARWHQAVRRALGCKLLVIDDTADRSIDADALLDHNWHGDHRRKYQGRLLREPRWLAGPRFALLAPAYQRAERYTFKPEVRSIGIFMGGTDPGSASSRVLDICRASGFKGEIEVASTPTNPHLAPLGAACDADPDTTLSLDQPDLAAFFARHDLQIGAGGGATWERCCIGAPTIAVVLSSNQEVVVPLLYQQGVLRAARLDPSGADDTPHLSQVLTVLIDDTEARRSLSHRAAELVDGRGAQRVALFLTRRRLALRPAVPEDAAQLHQWRNHPSVRAVSGDTGTIDPDSHRRWLQSVLASTDRWLFVAHVGHVSVGSIRFDRLPDSSLEVSLYLDPELAGLGLGPCLLQAGEHRMRQIIGHDFLVEASAMPGNVTSQRLFGGCGYDGGPQRYRKSVPTQPSAGSDDS